MNILFLSLLDISSIEEHGIYSDLLREFRRQNHNVYIVSPSERRTGEHTRVIENKSVVGGEPSVKVLKVRIGNTQKTNIIEKGISTLLLEYQIISTIKKHFAGIIFNIVIYATPPITFYKTIKYIKYKDNAICYLLLKDIFPQNAVDLGMISKNGLIYKYFRNKEKKLYALSDHIGCMSQANVEYIVKHNIGLDKKTHVSANSIEPADIIISADDKKAAREKYGIPSGAKVFLYGGNLGKPQDIPFIIECLKQNQDKKDRYFVICGTGTEYHKLYKYVNEYKPANIKLIGGLPKVEYCKLIQACDIGLIFLDNRFTIPNFPSRLLDYMESSMPVLACTDISTDIGMVITNGDFGWWCRSDNPDRVTDIIDMISDDEIAGKGRNARRYLEDNYTAEKSYDIILSKINALENQLNIY